MPTSTFNNLPEEKKQIIISALLKEFSNSSLSKAQVAPIVKEAKIARGAFYKYFADLADAYTFIYKLAMTDIHSNVSVQTLQTAQDYVKQASEFLTKTKNSKYYDLIKMHILYNEHFLPKRSSKHLSANIWAIAELSHATIRECLISPDKQNKYLDNLKIVLSKIID